ILGAVARREEDVDLGRALLQTPGGAVVAGDAALHQVEAAPLEHRLHHVDAGVEVRFLGVVEQRHPRSVSDGKGAWKGYATLVTRPERRQRVQTRMRRGEPSTSAWTRCRLGRWTRLVLMLEWLTLLPTRRPLLQISHVLAMIPSHFAEE